MSAARALGRAAAILLLGGGLAVTGWAAFAPLPSDTRDEVFEIPKGTWARRMAGDPVEILPERIRLTLGVRDILVLKNRDEVPQMFGPTLMMPGQSFRLPFAQASSYVFACSAHASGQMTIVVEPFPDGPWERLRWRLRERLRRLRSLGSFRQAARRRAAPGQGGDRKGRDRRGGST